MEYIVKMKFGSHLYGTATEASDTDYKGVYMPTIRQIFLNDIPESNQTATKIMSKGQEGIKNTKNDVDDEIYSLHKFIKLACEGKTEALDMLHANKESIIISSPTWDEIVKNRSKFYTKNMASLIEYGRKQAAKYGIKGSRINDAERVRDYLMKFHPSTKIYTVWNDLPTGNHLNIMERDPKGIRQYQVCGRKIQETVKVEYALSIINKFLEVYGKRAKMAADNKGIDWKAISHALRAAIQMEEILRYKTLTYPLKQADLLRNIKQGKLDYMTEVAPLLDKQMDIVEDLVNKSDLPIEVNKEFWDDFLVNIMIEKVGKYYNDLYRRIYEPAI